MREIKLRAWDGKRWLYRGIHDRNWYTESKRGKLVKGTHPRDKHMPIYEYAGLKDKNGVEIYEGDIYKWGFIAYNDSVKYGEEPWNNLPEGVAEDYISTELGTGFVSQSFKDFIEVERIISMNPDVIMLEVIGNIYENPELLEAPCSTK